MARNLQVALSLIARDGGSKAIRQAMQGILNQTKVNQKADDEQAKSQQRNTNTSIRASRSLQDEYRRASQARSTLGIRSERDIQREIRQTMAAYNRLTRTGTLSANEQSRAFQAMSSRVRQLRTELSAVNTGVARMKTIGATVGAVAGGVTAAGMVVAQPVSRQMSYQERLAMMANTAYADQGLEGRRAGMKDMDSLIRRSVREGGGTKESAAAALDAMLASGTVDMKSAGTLLPMLQKYSTATGASTEDLSQIAIRLKQTFDIKDEDIGKALNMAIASGQAGGFELADMAKWLPQQLAAASNVGMKGLDDLAVLLSLNQASVITAGTKDEAGNNVVNLLGKITSKDAATSASKISVSGSGKGIDLPGSLAQSQGKGINGLDAFVGIIDKIVASNPAYKKLDAQLKNAQGSERRGIMESQARILEGSAVGEMVADRQALMALIAYRSNRQYAREVKDAANAQRTKAEGETAGDLNFGLMSEQAGFKVNQLKNEREFSEMDAVKPLSDALGDVSDKLVRYAQEYPELTTAVSGATTAIKAMTAAAVAFAGLSILTGGGGIKAPGKSVLGRLWQRIRGGVEKVPGSSGASLAGEAAATAGNATATKGLSWALKAGGKLLGRAAPPLMLYQGAQDAPLIPVKRGDAQARERLEKNDYSSDETRMLDAVKARPGLLDVFDELKSWWSPPTTIGQSAETPFNPATTGVPSYLLPQQKEKPQPVSITTNLMLDGRVLAQVVNEYNGEQSVRGSTGGMQ
ncbi:MULTISPECIES: phage tail tape measure protein [Citrobacter]|uniref:phage tail tape measure protein n=1 Tax=Citrobacter TaxID=544 RepID=UPI001680977E|nr:MULTISPECIES: phage tail tape measure protein [Citrobacter]MCK7561606.1 phage tail tape measure protein [Citrobacter koseri]MDM2952788.1 phage tail tape measure protein [Citrobacter sp. CK203]MDM3032029.1 phage tail tape measure protein [Citrobacter sp. CK186]BCL49800.1 tail tape measure protein [Citrobacter koseri]